jgi:DNA modification methylase
MRRDKETQSMKIDVRDRIKELRRIPAKELRPHVKNWRRHPPKQIRAMRTVLREIGFAGAILAREDENGDLHLIDGHLRADVASDAVLPVLVLDVTEAEAEKILATLDPITGMAEIDEAAFAALIEGMDANLPEFQELLTELQPSYTKRGLIDEDTAPEIDPHAVSQLGDVWKAGEGHRIGCGDSTNSHDVGNVMLHDLADLVHLDPPYGTSYGGGRGSQEFGPILNDEKRGDALRKFLKTVFDMAALYKTPEAALYTWCHWSTFDVFWASLVAALFKPAACIVWDKQTMGLGYAHYRPQHEFLVYCPGTLWRGDRDQPDVWAVSRDPHVQYEHPTQKPVALIERAIRNSSDPGAIVLDLFGGSGSTLIACEKAGRVARLMEQDPRYVDIILRRWQQYTGRQVTLDGDGRTFDQVAEIRQSSSK